MSRGIIGLAGLALTLAFAVPIALLGLDMVASGNALVGAGFLGVAVLMLLVEEYLTTPLDLPGKAAEKAAETVVKEPEEAETEE